MSTEVLLPFQEYQKARVTFVQKIAELALQPKNIDSLRDAGAMTLLAPLLKDSVPMIRQNAALAIGRLVNNSKELAENAISLGVINILIDSIQGENRFFKFAACFVLKSVAKHSPELANKVKDCNAIEKLVQCLDEFDPHVKETAAWALGCIAKHNSNLADYVVQQNAVAKLIKCLNEPEPLLKKEASMTLSNISQHSEILAIKVVESGLEKITSLLTFQDLNLKRNICQLLGNIAKHSADLATSVLDKLQHPSHLLNCIKDQDAIVKKNAACCVCEIVSKSDENAKRICDAGGPAILVDYINNIKGDPRLYGILALGFIAAFDKDYAWCVIKAKSILPLRDSLQNEPHQHIKAAACYALGNIGRHSAQHADEVANANVLKWMLYYYMYEGSNDDLKEKSIKALISIIDTCENLEALEPLINQDTPDEILKHILQRYVVCLEKSKNARLIFLKNGFKKLQEIKLKASEPIQQLISEVNANFDLEIINKFSPDYSLKLLEKLENVDIDEK